MIFLAYEKQLAIFQPKNFLNYVYMLKVFILLEIFISKSIGSNIIVELKSSVYIILCVHIYILMKDFKLSTDSSDFEGK